MAETRTGCHFAHVFVRCYWELWGCMSAALTCVVPCEASCSCTVKCEKAAAAQCPPHAWYGSLCLALCMCLFVVKVWCLGNCSAHAKCIGPQFHCRLVGRGMLLQSLQQRSLSKLPLLA